mgnify:FL=1
MSAHEEFGQWDAAYVLGALSVADRRDYEQHLSECAECRRAVAELGPTMGLLGRLDAATAAAIDGRADGSAPVTVDDGGVRQTPAATRVRRLRPRVWAWAAAAVVAVAAVIAVPVALTVAAQPAASYTLQDVGGASLVASVRLSNADWGTRIQLDCTYPASARADDDGWEYALAVVDKEGRVSSVSTWRAYPGSAASLAAATALPLSDIAAVEIQAPDGTVVMRTDLSQSG